MDDDDDHLFEIDDDDDDDDDGIEDGAENPLASTYLAAAAAAPNAFAPTAAGEALSPSPEDLPVEEEEEGERGMGNNPYDANDWDDLPGGAEADGAKTR